IRQGLTATGYYIVLEGGASIIVGGKERSTLRPGDFFGEISCLLGEPPTADIVAKTPLRCLVLAPAAVEEFLVANPHVMYRVLQGEARKLRTTTRWLSGPTDPIRRVATSSWSSAAARAPSSSRTRCAVSASTTPSSPRTTLPAACFASGR